MLKFSRPGLIGRHRVISGRMAAASLVVFLLLGGCSLLPVEFHSTPSEQTLFLQGLDALSTTSSPEAFSRLSIEFPDSPWTARAKAITQIQVQLQEEQRQRSQQLKRLDECRLERDRLASDVRSREETRKALDACRLERDRLASDVPSREETLKALDACRLERERLAREVRSLEEYTRRLKSLLAESGIAEPTPPVR
jgi:hypothetical protein